MTTLDTHTAVKVSDVKRGDYVRLRPNENAPVWIRGDYDRATKTFLLESWGDIGHCIQRKGTVNVWIDFTF